MKYAFCGGTLVDGTGKPALKNSLVLVDDKKLVYCGAMAAVPEGYQAYDISGMTILPGLVDTHLHFSGNLTSDDTDWVMEPLLQKAVVAVQQAHDCLEAGLTTVGEISRFGIHIRNMVEQGVMTGPRIVAAGLGFCATASHGDSHKVSVEMNRESHPWAETADSPWGLRIAVRKRIRENPDAIKIWATGGDIWRWERCKDQHYTMEEIQAVVDECRMRQIPVWAHCVGSAYNCVKAGADVIVHGMDLDEETLNMMAEKNISLIPTISFMPDWLRTFAPAYIPAIHDPYPGETVADKELARIHDNVRKAAKKGILLTTGSDSFNSNLTPYGTTLIGELYAFVDHLGFSPLETIRCATFNGATVLKVSDITGSLEAGKFADLLVVNGDVLQDIHQLTTENMKVVMKEGKPIKLSL